jgi:hypothetical protein
MHTGNAKTKLDSMDSEVEQLKAVVEKLQSQVTRLTGLCFDLAYHNHITDRGPDQEDIRKLQYTYGYYLDKCHYKQVYQSQTIRGHTRADMIRSPNFIPTILTLVSSSSEVVTMAKKA